MEINYTAEPTIAEFHAGDYFFRGIRGPIGSGKTIGCECEIVRRAAEQVVVKKVRKSRWAALRGTYPELKSTTIQSWLEWFGPFTRMVYGSPIMGFVNIPLKDGTTINLELVFISADNPKDIKKLKGLELTGGWANEAVEIPFPIISMLAGRVARHPAKRDGGYNWTGVIADTNSCDIGNWWYKLAEEEKPEGWKFYNQPAALLKTPDGYVPNLLAENIDNLVDGYNYYIRQLAGKPKEWVQVFIENQYGSSNPGNRVYGDYSTLNHTEREFDPALRHIIWTHDFNFTPLSSAILQQDEKGDIYCVDEIVLKSAIARQSATEFVERYKEANHCVITIYGDASGHVGQKHGHKSDYIIIEEILRKAGFQVRMKVPLSDPPIKDGQSSLRALIEDAVGKRRLLVNPKKCKYVNTGLSSLQFKEGSTFQEEDNEYQHITTALRYFSNVEYPVRGKMKIVSTGE